MVKCHFEWLAPRLTHIVSRQNAFWYRRWLEWASKWINKKQFSNHNYHLQIRCAEGSIQPEYYNAHAHSFIYLLSFNFNCWFSVQMNVNCITRGYSQIEYRNICVSVCVCVAAIRLCYILPPACSLVIYVFTFHLIISIWLCYFVYVKFHRKSQWYYKCGQLGSKLWFN